MSNTVLIVDDCEFERRAFQLAFEAHGFKAITTGEADQVIPYAVGFKPDFVLLDLNMPTVSGFELCAMLKLDRNAGHSDHVRDRVR